MLLQYGEYHLKIPVYISNSLRVIKTSWIVRALKIGPIICAEK
jgi:siderophore synthetase component